MRIQEIQQAILGFDEERAAALVQAALDAGVVVSTILDDGLIAAMDEVGERFSEGTLFVPEMLRAAKAMKAGLAVLRPYIAGADVRSTGTVVIGTVKSDLHDIGKNLVGMMLEGAGFRVIDLGVDVSAESFLDAARDNAADIVAMSALLTTTMPAMKATVAGLREQDFGANFKTKVVVGGAPVNQAFADEIGADGFADDAPGAVELARRLVAECVARRTEESGR